MGRVPRYPARVCTEAMMETLSDVEAALKSLEREANELRSKEFREMLRELIEDQREIMKRLRKFYN